MAKLSCEPLIDAKLAALVFTEDDILPAFVPSISMAPGGPFEVDETVTNPTFTITAAGGAIATYSVTDSDANGPTAGSGPAVAGVVHPFSLVRSANNATLTFTATVVSGAGVIKTCTDSYVWRPRVFYGVAALAAFDEAFVEALAGSALAASRNRTISYNAGAAEYLFYAFPVSYGGGTPTFKDAVSGFDAGFSKVAATISVTNAHGNTQDYELWRSDQAELGAVDIIVT